MAHNFPPPPVRRPPEPFSAGQTSAARSGLFWSRLHTYRPLFLLGGLWFTLVCVSAIAYRGLMFNEPVETTIADEAPLITTAPLPTTLESLPDSIPVDLELPTAIIPTEETTARFSPVTLWGLLSLVSLCAFGCFVITQYIKASARPAKPKQVRPRPLRKAPAAQSPQRLSSYSPQRDGVLVPGGRVLETPTLSQTTAAPSAPSTQPQTKTQSRPMARPQRPMARPQPIAQALPATAALASARPHTPTVVPDAADLPLDWAEGSVAHALDMRQRRSLSSLM